MLALRVESACRVADERVRVMGLLWPCLRYGFVMWSTTETDHVVSQLVVNAHSGAVANMNKL
ncbi:hypothetical protein CMV24_18575 [Pseudomonas plecoglossicida]|uniref:Uncharacterized protein n=1 Tax=Pseudomonas plecoglossicida TaxID=70775 RepID=A0A2A3M1V7_PSEDL|nr:hypothetical protein CMV24_18575 [Pseudomonas plecoglossicida]